MAAELEKIIEATVQRAVDVALRAGLMRAQKAVDDIYKETEKRLNAHRILIQKVENDKGRLSELETHGVSSNSRSITRFSRTTTRLTPEEIVDALIKDLTATIAADQYEVDAIADVLETIKHDPYYEVIKGRFGDGRTDEQLAEDLCCDPSTVRRNRGRLIRSLAVGLYGVEAL